MANDRFSQHGKQSAMISSSVRYLVLSSFLGLGLAGCNDVSSDTKAGASTASQTIFDASLEQTPCEIAPKELIAKTFDVPADQFEVANSRSSTCDYKWEESEKMLAVTLGVEVFDTAEAASRNFRGVTRGLSAEEVSDATKGMVEKARETGELDSGTRQSTAKEVSSVVGGKGLHFEDVDGVADEARFGTRFGTLYARQGNLQLRLSAYHGSSMTMPKKFTPGASMKAIAAWEKETMPARKQQSIKLAKAIVETL